jgi:hypothetical protein
MNSKIIIDTHLVDEFELAENENDEKKLNEMLKKEKNEY